MHAVGSFAIYSTAGALLRFPAENIEELSGKIVKLLTDGKLREEMGKASMEKVKEYDWIKIADRKVEIYREVIANFHERKGKKHS